MKKAILVLLCCAMLGAAVSCGNHDYKQTSENDEELVNKEISNINTSVLLDENSPSNREILENLAAVRCTLDYFKQKFPNYRMVSDNVDYCTLKTNSLQNTYFYFQRLNGENGFSKYILQSISAPADILLPEFLNLSFEEITNKVEHSFRSPRLDIAANATSNLYIYKESFFYEVRGSVHGDQLTTEYVFIYPYSEGYLPIESIDSLTQINYKKFQQSYKDTLEDIICGKYSLEEFNKAFTQTNIRTNEKYVFASFYEFLNVEFCFKLLTDSIHGREDYILYSVTANASILLPDYVGQDFFYLNQKTRIFEFIPNSLDIVSYEENYSYKISYDDFKGYTKLKGNMPVTLLLYTDTWIRPW